MPADRAAAELEATGRQFLVYWDKNADQMQVVYRRGDESFGIVQPVRKSRR
jgi:hypothetical protein